MSEHKIPPPNDVEIDGLIEEIMTHRNKRDDDVTLSDGTVRLLVACRNKIAVNTSLTPTERQKVEGIYAFFCR